MYSMENKILERCGSAMHPSLKNIVTQYTTVASELFDAFVNMILWDVHVSVIKIFRLVCYLIVWRFLYWTKCILIWGPKPI